jgi:hypothetical protein
MLSIKNIAVLFLLIFSLTSCDDNIRNQDTDVSGAKSHIMSEQYFGDGFIWAHKVFSDGDFLTAITELKKNETAIKSLTYSNTTYPVEVTFNFGSDSNNVCLDGRTRNGEFKIKIWSAFKNKNSTFRVITQNYFINDIELEIEDTVSSIGSVDGFKTYESTIRKGYMFADTIIVEWSANKTWSWQAGDATASYDDDIYYVDDEVKALAYNGSSYRAETTSSMIWTLSCNWINVGTILMQPENVLLRKIDFGVGLCENLVQVNTGAKEFNVTID